MPTKAKTLAIARQNTAMPTKTSCSCRRVNERFGRITNRQLRLESTVLETIYGLDRVAEPPAKRGQMLPQVLAGRNLANPGNRYINETLRDGVKVNFDVPPGTAGDCRKCSSRVPAHGQLERKLERTFQLRLVALRMASAETLTLCVGSRQACPKTTSKVAGSVAPVRKAS